MTPVSTSSPGPDGSTRSWRAWTLWSEPRRLILYLVAVETAATVGSIAAAISLQVSGAAIARALSLFTLAVVFEEATRQAGRMRLRLSDHLKPDMTSVWSFPAAILVPAPYAIACVAALLLYMWVRQQRPAGESAHRKLGTAATIVIACLSTHWVFERIDTYAFAGANLALGVVIGLFVYTAVNRGLVTVALLMLGVRGRGLVGSWEDNLLEVATLCLGGLVALAVRDQPWLALLVLLPMVLLERGALTRQLEVAASTDSKTGLLNAAAWEMLAQRELARAQREGYPTAVLIIDLDQFKAVNDVYGHLVGDLALRAVARCLASVLRGYDAVGRFGGEEFVALLPAVGENDAVRIAQRLRVAINQIRISHVTILSTDTIDRALAVSIGLACSPTDGEELADVLHNADTALYRAKQGGRNLVTVALRGGGDADAGGG